MWKASTIQVVLAYLFVALAAVFIMLPVPTYYSGGGWGHLVGAAGTVLMIMTLVYPFRKRVLGRKGKKNPINPHILYGLLGPILVLIHSGHRFESLIANLAYGAMLVIVLSGLTGRYLFKKVNRGVKQQKQDLAALREHFERRRQDVGADRIRLYLHGEGADDPAAADEEMDDLTLKKIQQLEEIVESTVDGELQLAAFDKTKALFRKWLNAHIYLTVFLFAMIVVHVLTTLYYGWTWL